VSAILITKFNKGNAYETLIWDLSQLKQEVLKNVKVYINRIKDFFAKITHNIRAQ
jgi:hypothetical protein